MKESIVNIQVVQACPAARRVLSNAATAEKLVRESVSDIVLLPELFLTGYQVHELCELALTRQAPIVRQLEGACRQAGVALVTGFIELGSNGELYNSLLAIDSNGVQRGPIRKTHLFGEERALFSPGNALNPVELCGYNWGIINCFELEFPEVARTLALKGAQGFLIVSANMRPYEDDHVFTVRVRSKENRVPSAYCNRVGHESGYEFCGLSLVVDQDGNVLHAMDETSEHSMTVPLTMNADAFEAVDMLSQRKPSLYL